MKLKRIVKKIYIIYPYKKGLKQYFIYIIGRF